MNLDPTLGAAYLSMSILNGPVMAGGWGLTAGGGSSSFGGWEGRGGEVRSRRGGSVGTAAAPELEGALTVEEPGILRTYVGGREGGRGCEGQNEFRL